MDDREMSLSSHLTELRRRILTVLIPLIALLPVAIWAAPWFLDALFMPLRRAGCAVYLYYVTDALALRMGAAVLMDAAVLMPLLLCQAYRFVAPGLYAHERLAVIRWGTAGGGLFLLGAAGFALGLTGPLVSAWRASTEGFPPVLSGVKCFELWCLLTVCAGALCALPCCIVFARRVLRGMKEEGTAREQA